MDDLSTATLKEMIAQALENCHDADLLDLIYKLLATNVAGEVREGDVAR